MLKPQHRTNVKRIKVTFLVAILTTIFFGAVKSTPANATVKFASESCPDVEFIFARGSRAGDIDSTDTAVWQSAFESLELLKNLKTNFYTLGDETYNGASYPAAEIGTSSLKSVSTTLSALFSGYDFGTFSASVNEGARELIGRLQAVSTVCPETKFVLGGYSQGAMVLNRAYKKLDPNKIIFIATFGDPNLYLPEGEGINPDACRNKNFSAYRIYAPNCRAYEGILGGLNPYVPDNLTGKIGLWCNRRDIMCTKYLDLSDPIGDHIAYVSDGIYQKAAKYILQKIAEAFPDRLKNVETVSPLHARDTAVLIDTTKSMLPYIHRYKAEALKVAKDTLENGGHVALFEFRDGEADGPEYAPHELCDFSCTLEQFTAGLESLTTGGGGDLPESALAASLGAMNRLEWQKGATKSIVLLTDATYHAIDFDGTTLSDVVKRSLEIDPVNFYVLTVPSKVIPYTSLTRQTSGAVFELTDAGLADSSRTLLSRPSLDLDEDSYSGTIGETMTFLLRSSATDVDHFEWDLDFDGIFETTTTLPLVSKVYDAEASGYLQARIVTTSGLVSSAAASIQITALYDLEPSAFDLPKLLPGLALEQALKNAPNQPLTPVAPQPPSIPLVPNSGRVL